MSEDESKFYQVPERPGAKRPDVPPEIPAEPGPGAGFEVEATPGRLEAERMTGEDIVLESKWRRLIDAMTDPEVKRAAGAAFRTIANAGIAALDMIPVAGDTASLSADALKYAKYIKYFGRKLKLDKLDLTPAVSRKIALGSEAAEFATVGFLPTHAIEGFLQLKRQDWGLMKNGLKRAREILSGEQQRYRQNPEIEEAVQTFLPKRPPIVG
jgi:hypothetical protein